MMQTWMLSNGEESTGISGVICGLDCPIIDTSRVSPAMMSPNEGMSWDFFHRQRVVKRLHNDMNCMVSYPFAKGRWWDTMPRRLMK